RVRFVLCLFPNLRRTPTLTLFPYTTLFRSRSVTHMQSRETRSIEPWVTMCLAPPLAMGRTRSGTWQPRLAPKSTTPSRRSAKVRSEEHTSELQSRENLVCRLLLEKKKPQTRNRRVPVALDRADGPGPRGDRGTGGPEAGFVAPSASRPSRPPDAVRVDLKH